MKNSSLQIMIVGAAVGILFLAAGCQTQNEKPASSTAATFESPPSVAPAAPPATESPAPVVAAPQSGAPALVAGPDGVYRVKAGSPQPFTDSAGHVWQADTGFNGGDTVDRDPSLKVENTKDPGMFLNEHYGMDSFACRVPNGNYTAKLYFAETFDGITGPGERVFSFNAQGNEFKDVDLWVKAGGPNRAYVVTVPASVTDGVFRITFTPNVENPEINAIELIPQT